MDIEQRMAHEREQQRLVEEIVDSLQRATHDDASEDGYIKTFFRVGREAMAAALGESEIAGPADHELYAELVQRPIEKFTTDVGERNYLGYVVGMRLVAPGQTRLYFRQGRPQLLVA